jgi:hypothetical protein
MMAYLVVHETSKQPEPNNGLIFNREKDFSRESGMSPANSLFFCFAAIFLLG